MTYVLICTSRPYDFIQLMQHPHEPGAEAQTVLPCKVTSSSTPMRPEWHAETMTGVLVQELGADEAIDYTSSRFEEVLKSHPVDVVIDPMAGAGLHRLCHMLL